MPGPLSQGSLAIDRENGVVLNGQNWNRRIFNQTRPEKADIKTDMVWHFGQEYRVAIIPRCAIVDILWVVV